MFDRLSTHHHSYGGPSRVDVNVTEKKAPTDESVRLLAEMQQKVIDNVLGQLKIDVNGVTGEILVLRQPWSLCSIAIGVAYNINGKRHHFKTDINDVEVWQQENEFHCSQNEAILRLFAKKFADHIAAQILNNLNFDDFNQVLGTR